MNASLYYPYATIHTSDGLEKALLYFDQIQVINPWELMTDRGSRVESDEYWRQADKIEKLHNHEKHLVEYISPLDLIKDYGDSISEDVKEDMENKSLVKFFRNLLWSKKDDEKTWELSSKKIPLPLREFINRYLDAANLPQWKSDEHTVVKLPFDIAEVIMINHVLKVVAEKSLPAFTDERIHDLALNRKLKSLMANPLIKEELKDKGFIREAKINMTAEKVINQTIPTLKGVELDTILNFRDDHQDTLTRFRSRMSDLATKIQSNHWDDEFKDSISNIVKEEITPAINELKESTKGETNYTMPVESTAYPNTGAVMGAIDSIRDSKRRHYEVINTYAYLFEASNLIYQQPN
jgi:hypothetical protein